MMSDFIKILFAVAISELTLVLILMILFSTVTTVIKILMMAFVFVSWAALIMGQEEQK